MLRSVVHAGEGGGGWRERAGEGRKMLEAKRADLSYRDVNQGWTMEYETKGTTRFVVSLRSNATKRSQDET